MAKQSQAERNRKQRDRQREVRERHKAERRPSRDDIARILLHWYIVGVQGPEREAELEAMGERLARGLAKQGFDEAASRVVFENLVEKYTREHWDFQRKPHLLFPDGPPDQDLPE
ncbi:MULTISPECIES: hypothetical protein [unclassified Rhizobium]|uniref:hypothetical protein n=1 Tax=unclassified Rhizobium TaxID=2613769 RepID=UPI001ADCCB38|nr:MULTISPECIES: hypothetical protein [unclassified Rhizobium]MBO9127729.1 hypothetical protein [Rhizobium sp. 16-488-2b]MBO9178191.1 hypothetical protein [Rhizobium sp. 16-488-2a]